MAVTQGIKTTTTKVTIGGANNKSSKKVTVPPHTRMINGKPVLVAGYTYTRKG